MHSDHYFFALALPDEMKSYLHSISERIKGRFPFKNWVHPEDYHITLTFLGKAEKDRLAQSAEFVADSVRGTERISLRPDQAGTFGQTKSPRILWIGTTGTDQLAALRKNVYSACHQAGFELETRPFKPHITIARKWAGEDSFSPQKLRDLIYTGLPGLPGAAYEATEVVLYRTRLDHIPKYEMMESFKLI
ncbi:RNA 2',3'-cyclic phosphodiesterase [Siminovitchia sp. 179-K 8D1 HS]|uniref:RNA 2',3'-cyclic phosphodiesterase n=1 Tax=Siminovitchia sp. 179-K 8D1 HS TaxID=3142385 RepID=UPI0039A0DB5B